MKKLLLIAAAGLLIAAGCGQVFAQAKINRDGTASATAPSENAGKMKNVDLQKLMNKRSKTEETTSKILKKQSDTASGVRQKY